MDGKPWSKSKMKDLLAGVNRLDTQKCPDTKAYINIGFDANTRGLGH